MWFKIFYLSVKRNGWRQIFFYLGNLDIYRFIEYSIIIQYLKEENNTGTTLDIGGGYSIFASLYKFNDYTLVDLSKGACEYQKIHGVKSICTDMRNIPLEAKSVSTIIAISSIEHVPDDDGVFKEISRLMKDDGIAIITVPFTNKKTVVKTIIRSPRAINILHKYIKIWGFILGKDHLQYFLEQTSVDTTIKYYSLDDLEKVLSRYSLRIADYKLFGKKLIGHTFKIIPPGWFVLKDILLGWPEFYSEKYFYSNNDNAGGIVMRVVKK